MLGGCTHSKKVSHERPSVTPPLNPLHRPAPATESQNSDLGFLNSITSKKTHPNSASCVPSPSFPWGSQFLKLKLYMAFALSHVQFNFGSPRSRWSGGGSATARSLSFSRLNRAMIAISSSSAPTTLPRAKYKAQEEVACRWIIDIV